MTEPPHRAAPRSCPSAGVPGSAAPAPASPGSEGGERGRLCRSPLWAQLGSAALRQHPQHAGPPLRPILRRPPAEPPLPSPAGAGQRCPLSAALGMRRRCGRSGASPAGAVLLLALLIAVLPSPARAEPGKQRRQRGRHRPGAGDAGPGMRGRGEPRSGGCRGIAVPAGRCSLSAASLLAGMLAGWRISYGTGELG